MNVDMPQSHHFRASPLSQPSPTVPVVEASVGGLSGVGAGGGADVSSAATDRAIRPPGVGEVFDWGRQVLKDPQTGREIWQLTSGTSTNHAPYMYCQAFDADERHAIVSSDLTGAFELYRVDIHTGRAARLTDLRGINNLMIRVMPDGRSALVSRGARCYRVSLVDGRAEVVMDLTDCGVADDDNNCTAALSGDGTCIAALATAADGRTMICYKSLASPAVHVAHVFAQGEVVCHLNFCPADNNLVSYVMLPDRQDNMALPSDQRARARTLDLATGHITPFLIAPLGFRCTHEYWSPDGQWLYTHVKHVPDWTPASIGRMPRTGGPLQILFTCPHRKLGHSSVNSAGTHVVTDNQEPIRNDLLLIDIRTGVASTLCWPNASGKPHPNHVHPAFSRTGRYVIYTSDASGSAQVFVVPLSDSDLK